MSICPLETESMIRTCIWSVELHNDQPNSHSGQGSDAINDKNWSKVNPRSLNTGLADLVALSYAGYMVPRKTWWEDLVW